MEIIRGLLFHIRMGLFAFVYTLCARRIEYLHYMGSCQTQFDKRFKFIYFLSVYEDQTS